MGYKVVQVIRRRFGRGMVWKVRNGLVIKRRWVWEVVGGYVYRRNREVDFR